MAFRLGTDLPPRAAPYSHDEVAAAIEAAAGAIEVVGSRIAGGLSGIGRLLSTADSGVNIALALGRWTEDWRILDLKALPVLIIGGFSSIGGVIAGGMIVGASEKLAEVYIGSSLGGGIESWFAYAVATVFLLFLPQGLFGEKMIQRV